MIHAAVWVLSAFFLGLVACWILFFLFVGVSLAPAVVWNAILSAFWRACSGFSDMWRKIRPPKAKPPLTPDDVRKYL
jgi:hypothetical protein